MCARIINNEENEEKDEYCDAMTGETNFAISIIASRFTENINFHIFVAIVSQTSGFCASPTSSVSTDR